MKIYTINILLTYLSLMVSCKNTLDLKGKRDLTFLGEYIHHDNTIFNGSKIGGLSGIDYNGDGNYYLVSDDSKNPRFYTSKILLSTKGIDTIIFEKVTLIKDSLGIFDSKTHLDLEDLTSWKNNNTLLFTGEGSIENALDPTLITTEISGIIKAEFSLPSYYSSDPTHKNRPRHNGVFEGLTASCDQKGVWTATELPLILDGPEPTITDAGAPVRITYFDYDSKKATYQFTYPLEPLAKDPKEDFGVNGVTAILQLDKNIFWIVERSYSKGYGTQGNTVQIYEADISTTTNTLDLEVLDGQDYQPASKKLIFDFETIRNQLTNTVVDNIEGITLGPILEDGKQSVILVSDNNFNPPEIQMNQFILLQF